MSELTVSSPPSAAPSLWRHRSFLLLWGGQSVSELGSEVTALVLPLLAVTVLHASTFAVAMLGLAGRLPFLLLSLPAGVVVDRLRRRTLMICCDVGRMVLLASVPLTAVLRGAVPLWQLYVVAVGVGVLSVFFDVAYQSYLPSLIPHEQLMDGNGKLGVTAAFAGLVGPSLGGALSGLVGAARAVAADAASYAVSVLALGLIRSPEPRPEPGAARVGFRAAMGEGLSFVVRHPVLRRIVACTATANLFLAGLTAVEVVYLIRQLHASTAETGAVLSAGAIGAIVGGALSGRLSRRIGSARIIWMAMLLPAPLNLLLPLAGPGWGLLLFALGLAQLNASGILYNTAQVSYRQAICPPGLAGRMNASIRWLVWGTLPLGALFGGALGSWAGLHATVWICSAGAGLAGFWVLFSPLGRMRDVPRPEADSGALSPA
ncbi:MFS transporter [Streptacidiphilus monticola]|uniref:MFS transporter n=1 Tax=Streptacidiphilus monticola TaxID=2161674 RepID=A0ABW1FVD6_9ACTN